MMNYVYHHILRLWFGYKHTKPLLFFPPSNFPHDVSVVMAWTVSNCTTWIWGSSNMCTFRICRSTEMLPWCLVHVKMPWIRDIPCSDTSGAAVSFATRDRCYVPALKPLIQVHHVKMPGESTMYFDPATRPFCWAWSNFLGTNRDGQTRRIHQQCGLTINDRALIMV